jgi:hypothetical protein
MFVIPRGLRLRQWFSNQQNLRKMLRELASAFKGIIILKESRFTLLGHLR